jgi:hypothetical protein
MSQASHVIILYPSIKGSSCFTASTTSTKSESCPCKLFASHRSKWKSARRSANFVELCLLVCTFRSFQVCEQSTSFRTHLQTVTAHAQNKVYRLDPNLHLSRSCIQGLPASFQCTA